MVNVIPKKGEILINLKKNYHLNTTNQCKHENQSESFLWPQNNNNNNKKKSCLKGQRKAKAM